MDPAFAGAPAAPPIVFEDGLGQRLHAVAGTQPIEILTLREDLTAVPTFEFALRERVSRLANLQADGFVRVRRVERIERGASTLAIVSDQVAGIRLAEILAVAEKRRRRLEINAAICLIRQLVATIATLHEKAPDVCHGAIAPERIIVPPDGRLVVVEHTLGAALEQLRYSQDRYWKELRIPLPRTVGLARFDRRVDVMQIGTVALALILGRPLRDNEYPALIDDMANSAWGMAATGDVEPLTPAFRTWLSRMLQGGTRGTFTSAIDARVELESVFEPRDNAAQRAALEAFLRQAPPAAVAAAPKKDVAKPEPQPEPDPLAAAFEPEAVEVPAPAPVVPSPADRTDDLVPLKPELVEPEVVKTAPAKRLRWAAVAAALVALASGGTLAGRYLVPATPVATTGTLVVRTNPEGAGVMIDGKPRGLSPVTVTLEPGDHVLELLTENDKRTIPVTITAGGQVSQFVDLPKAVTALGQLNVRTEPAGARVTVDGHTFGRSPVTIQGLTPGTHKVTLESDLGTLTEEVLIEAGITASMFVPLTGAKGAPVSGWIAIAAPVDVQVFENKRLLGSSRTDRIMVPVGTHELEIVNEALGYRATRTVNVTPGAVAAVRLQWPEGSLALNAVPWAEVFIDGQRVGETPIGHVAVPIGPHEVVFKHPELGERRSTVLVTLAEPARLSIDLRKR